jgi:hypothetical protein
MYDADGYRHVASLRSVSQHATALSTVEDVWRTTHEGQRYELVQGELRLIGAIELRAWSRCCSVRTFGTPEQE